MEAIERAERRLEELREKARARRAEATEDEIGKTERESRAETTPNGGLFPTDLIAMHAAD